MPTITWDITSSKWQLNNAEYRFFLFFFWSTLKAQVSCWPFNRFLQYLYICNDFPVFKILLLCVSIIHRLCPTSRKISTMSFAPLKRLPIFWRKSRSCLNGEGLVFFSGIRHAYLSLNWRGLIKTQHVVLHRHVAHLSATINEEVKWRKTREKRIFYNLL